MKINSFYCKRILLLFGLFISTSYAQIKTNNENSWFHYVGKNRLTEKLSFTFDLNLINFDYFIYHS